MRRLPLVLAALGCATATAPSTPDPANDATARQDGPTPFPASSDPGTAGDAPPSGVTAPRGRSRAESLARFRQGVAAVSFEVQVHPPGGADVAGFVLSRDGKPVPRACVELAGSRRPPPVFTSSQGDFRFGAVPPGTARVTITVDDLASLSEREIADYHHQDPNLTVLIRPLLLASAPGQLSVAHPKRQGGLPGHDAGTQWIEVAPMALDLDGYTATCRQALRRQRR